ITEKQAVMTSDILPTTYEIGVLPGNIQKDYNVLIVGAGPIGISGMVSVLTLLGKEGKLIVADIDDERLKNALKVGAHEVVNSKDHDAAVKRIMEITNGKGVDVALECVGYPATWNLCHDTVGVGGHISVVGVHGTPVSFDLAKHWINNMTVSTGLVNANTTVDLLNKIKTGKIDTNVFINKPEHADFKFSKMLDAYHAFSHAQESKAFKVIITNDFTFNPLLVKPNN
ncbi:zinc-binding dehydrogenase, partial [Mycoplasma elephantis]|uniref:zinc-binding dehydrogenase n=1 Tax=Mycoplasma elephantis TaxID=114882 RepID=UPI0004854894